MPKNSHADQPRPPVAVLSFEGPDPYSMVGGLGVRATELAVALGERGYPTELVFIGDPHKPPVETYAENVQLRRWGQWISAYHPKSVYDGQEGKINDYTASVPAFLIEAFIAPAAERGEVAIVLAEDWQTAPAVLALDRELTARGLRSAARIFWNANNTYGFERIDFSKLAAAATITAVSKYMKFELSLRGAPALVIPNGIPERLLRGPKDRHVDGFRTSLGGRPLLVKVGRFDPDKAWFSAIDAVAKLRAEEWSPRLVVRGGREGYANEVFARARDHGLRIEDVRFSGNDPADLFAALDQTTSDIVNLHAFLEAQLLYALYAAADAVLANSKKEPFGLVGLEVMAAGGLAVCGATGEEYAEPFVNAIVCDLDDGSELASYLAAVVSDKKRTKAIRANGRATAERYTWEHAIDTLERKLAFATR
jgi:glycosyltransferase involved in cell wall biosynthesis